MSVGYVDLDLVTVGLSIRGVLTATMQVQVHPFGSIMHTHLLAGSSRAAAVHLAMSTSDVRVKGTSGLPWTVALPLAMSWLRKSVN